MKPTPRLCALPDCGHPMPCHRRYGSSVWCERCRRDDDGGAGDHAFAKHPPTAGERLDRVLGWITVDEEAGR